MPSSNCCFLTCIQISQEADQVVWYSRPLKNFPQFIVIHTVKGFERDQPWDFFGRNDAKAETAVLWPPDSRNWLTGKDPDAGKDWRQEIGMTEDEMVGWHHWLDGHEFEQVPEVGDGQVSLVCCSPRGCKESDRLSNWTNWTENRIWNSGLLPNRERSVSGLYIVTLII